MPNNKKSQEIPDHLLIVGPLSLLEAAQKEVSKIPVAHLEEPSGGEDFDGLIVAKSLAHWSTIEGFRLPEGAAIKLTLPQDWDQLMDLLEGLKQPKVPEYVQSANTGQVYKIDHGDWEDRYSAFTVKGQEIHLMNKGIYTPITEEEFIQGGLKELEEAGFVVGARVKAGSQGNTFTIGGLGYLPTQWEHNSKAVEEEVKAKGFCFPLLTPGAGSIPVGQCTLLPKAQTLPTTSQGIPYFPYQQKVVLGHVMDNPLELDKGTLRYWLKQGVTSITFSLGTLTQEDLTKLASL